jgi:nucleoid DNA-binding protein
LYLKDVMTKRDLVGVVSKALSTETETFGRRQASNVVDVVFGSITEALQNGDTVNLPDLGTFEVREHTRKPTRAWTLNRVRVTYRKRKFIRFIPGD